FRPLSPVLWVEESFFSLGERLVGSSRGAGRALRTHAHYVCVRLRRGRDRGDSSYSRIFVQQVSSQKTCEGDLYANRCRPRKLRKTHAKRNGSETAKVVDENCCPAPLRLESFPAQVSTRRSA